VIALIAYMQRLGTDIRNLPAQPAATPAEAPAPAQAAAPGTAAPATTAGTQ